MINQVKKQPLEDVDCSAAAMASLFFQNHKMCLFTLLKYSPLTLKRVRGLIEGRQAYIVGGVAHVDDLAVADELNVPILGPEPAVSRLCNSKSEGRRIFAAAEVDVPPGQGDVYSLSQVLQLSTSGFVPKVSLYNLFLCYLAS